MVGRLDPFGLLQNSLQVDGHRVSPIGDQVLLVQVTCGEGVQQCQPGAGAAEVRPALRGLRAPGVIDELGPTVAVPRHDTGYSQRHRSFCIESLDEYVAPGIDTNVPGLVHDSPAVAE